MNGSSSRQHPRIRLIGNHSHYHCGSEAVFSYLSTFASKIGCVVGDEDDYDMLIVNGEGSMHHSSRRCHSKMAALESALKTGKKAHLINSVWQDNSLLFNKVLKKLDSIIVREDLSKFDLLKNHGIESKVRLDLSYWSPVDESVAFRELKRNLVVGDFYDPSIRKFDKIYKHRHFPQPLFVGMRHQSWSALIKSLRTASLFVTGRHHGVFAACRAKIPFVAINGNTHKIIGLIKTSRINIPVCFSLRELSANIQWCLRNPSAFCDLFSWMDAQPSLNPSDLGL